MPLPVSPAARRVFAAMVFGSGAPSFDWQRATETGEGVVSSVAPGTAAQYPQTSDHTRQPGGGNPHSLAQQEEMPPLCSIRLKLPLSSTYADGAAVFLIATSLMKRPCP